MEGPESAFRRIPAHSPRFLEPTGIQRRQRACKRMQDEPIRSLVYIARTEPRFTDAQLDALLAEARDFNRQQHVTGVLLVCDGEVIQNLEGPAAGVAEVLGRVRESRRIRDFAVMLDTTIPTRCFADWDMGVARTTTSEMLTLSNARWKALLAEDRPTDRVCRGLRQLRNFWDRHVC